LNKDEAYNLGHDFNNSRIYLLGSSFGDVRVYANIRPVYKHLGYEGYNGLPDLGTYT